MRVEKLQNDRRANFLRRRSLHFIQSERSFESAYLTHSLCRNPEILFSGCIVVECEERTQVYNYYDDIATYHHNYRVPAAYALCQTNLQEPV